MSPTAIVSIQRHTTASRPGGRPHILYAIQVDHDEFKPHEVLRRFSEVMVQFITIELRP